jgi:beta-galactosidase
MTTRPIMTALAGGALAAALLAGATTSLAQEAKSRKDWVSQGQLYIGVNYQPVDRSPDEIKLDIAFMKKAGLQVARIGDLSWDHFEPKDGQFAFEVFDSVLAQLHAAGIKVILDMPGSIAPQWLHQAYPGATLVKEDGSTLYPARRYMVDISDPDYRRLQRRIAEQLTRRYGMHPAVIAVGYNNEMGNGYRSYSEPARQRFIVWLKAKYGDLAALNKAWATQRWSRTISDWDQVRLPNAEGAGASERYLDMRRFWSDASVAVLTDLEAIRKQYAHDKPALSNLWPDGPRLGFDWLATYRQYATHGAFGYYATEPLEGAFDTMMARGGMTAPVWFNEFQAGGEGNYGERGRSRMLAYLGLLNGGQAALAWTMNSHLGGEEQILFGLLDHDNTPSWKLDEWGRLATEFKAMQQLGFPREMAPQVAISYSWESLVATGKVKQYYSTPYMTQKHNAFKPLYADNVDTAVINIGFEDLSRYKLLVVPGEYLMDKKATDALRAYVGNGGTVVMTASSGKVDATNQWHNTALPGGLTDVFGVKTHEFNRPAEPLSGTIDGAAFTTSIHFYELLEPSTAQVMARFSNLDGAPPVVTSNRYGKGRAIYVTTQAQPSVLQPLYRQLYRELGIARGPVTPEGVYARVVNGRTLYVNTNRKAVEVDIDGQKKGVLSGETWSGKLQLGPNGVDVVQ